MLPSDARQGILRMIPRGGSAGLWPSIWLDQITEQFERSGTLTPALRPTRPSTDQ